ncbi:MAG: SUKH-3 domain-containing protein [Acidobacteriota bacterium]
MRELLTKSGWFAGRNIDSEALEQVLIDEGYEIFSVARSFFKEFGFLRIEFNDVDTKKNIILCIDARSASFKSVIDAYSRHCGKRMIPVAEVPYYDMTICIAEDGDFYGGNDDWLLELGHDFYETLFNLVSGKKITPEMVKLDD